MPPKTPPEARRFVFVSSVSASTWGGSEELWAAAALRLAERGHCVTVYKPNLDETQRSIRRLRALGCTVEDLARPPLLPETLFALQRRLLSRLGSRHLLPMLWFYVSVSRQYLSFQFIRRCPPSDLVIISQGVNHDGATLASACQRLGRRFVLIAQKASNYVWPTDVVLPRMRSAYTSADAAYFVSEHNLRLTEEQLGCDVPRAEVVRNPYLVPWAPREDWPCDEERAHLACVGRLYAAEKGQDLLLRVLARNKWRARPLQVSFFGSGPHSAAIQRLADYLGLTSVSFRGFESNVSSIWDTHQGLILPSRAEGLPLVLVEAMLSGRVPIVTDVAGSREVVDDNVTGFLAATPTEDSLDEAMKRAWQRRDEWRAIGCTAAERIRSLVPPDPGEDFATRLLELAG
jgi:glycosyltransferase involved in cell wall biosynthesis